MGQCLSCILGGDFDEDARVANGPASPGGLPPKPTRGQEINTQIDKRLQQLDDQQRDMKKILLLGRPRSAPAWLTPL
mgnify:CR=1 FL=1